MVTPLAPKPSVPLHLLRSQLPMTARFPEPLSDAALFELCAANRMLRIERAATGELTIMSPTGGETGRRNFALAGLFYPDSAPRQGIRSNLAAADRWRRG